MWEKVKGAARLAWIIIQIISIPMAVVGTLFLLGILPRKRKSTGSGDNGSGTSEIGGNLDNASERQSDIEAISDRFGKLLAEGRDILAKIRARDGSKAGQDDPK